MTILCLSIAHKNIYLINLNTRIATLLCNRFKLNEDDSNNSVHIIQITNGYECDDTDIFKR